MATSWYYAHDEKKLGPFSPTQLRDLAAAGTILPIDTVWIEGNEKGVPASRVRHLFSYVAPNPPQATVEPTVVVESPPPALVELAPPPPVKPKERPAKKGRATALSGADMVGQDGVQARYRKKCMKCGHKDAACHMITITNKTFKSIFFCPKCRKKCDVVVQCQI